jgi:hypothetical protein
MRKLYIIGLIAILSVSAFAEELVKRGDRRPVVENYGKTAAAALKGVLKTNLQEKMKNEGAVGAMRFCANNAMQLTNMINRDAKKGIRIKRVSLKFRNPANEPDKLDKLAFEYFAQMKEKDGVYPANFITRLRHKADKDIEIFRYYEPLLTDTACLACHGEKLAPEVAAELKHLYPNDLATGYKQGDLRGLIAVEVTPDALTVK